MYYVIGGEYTDTTFTKFLDGKGKKFGPFNDYEEARKIWARYSWLDVDNCNCRYFIVEEEKNDGCIIVANPKAACIF